LTYVHIRAHHAEYGWPPERARTFVLSLVRDGYLPQLPSTSSPTLDV